MRDRLLNVQTLLPGIITNAVQLTKCDRSNALTYGAPPWAEYGDEWKKFVSQNFDKIAEAGVDLVVKVSAKDYTSATQPNKKPYDGIRTCAVQINTFFRADLPSNIKKVPGFNLSELLPFIASTEPKYTIQPESKRVSTTTTRSPPEKKDMRDHTRYVCRAEDKKPKNAKERLTKLRHIFKKKISQMMNDRQEAFAKYRLVVQDLNSAEGQQVFLEEEGTLNDDSPETSTPGQSVCSLICNTLKKLFPPKKQYYFTRALCPSTSFSSSSALHLDSVALYQLLTQNLDQEKSEEQPSNATFNAVFDVGEIQKAYIPPYSRPPIEKSGKGVTKVGGKTIVNPGYFNYAGTDNGLVKMTASIPVSLPRMKAHLKVLNYYISYEYEG
ncbi:hypothetical protein PHYBLDRAFT_139835 [Phycomyces blakesleeanus NRRL 1555(-)]|uniref:Uncharacterized protein n=1 Tax=Phycomyces blakesleeanus (strain ATCC 8743b / DSM 1359 / FGSC 10004 / NBRC 33097 / NRRL 1555) TaxID=763407 RepID=A0A162Q3X6_PHYB8|nr:hypothetical protein PHYBLDRAFT_139835 [Phycomyces blakesleeanus NRRL 1555(-)]OAD79816.1 hypothetical protein PHYBLDRAFT_139835 [Phycomyces blakesleeanus NRRL 1555(-)]|eukprot:XP_018297856.1 hypothetical protein PHYBLDRAFT_139835 [Phycomyces blakesleeanus NRRL 1555(-)]